jgi:putative ABC transport system ATP-binding protein
MARLWITYSVVTMLNPAEYSMTSPQKVPPIPGLKDGSIHLHKLVKHFKNAAGEFIVLKGLDVNVPSGQFISVVGKSGSGKSTLLNMITGIDRPTSGDVLVGGVNIQKLSESQRALWRGKNLGIVFQFFQLLPMLTLHENIMLPMDYTNIFLRSERPRRAMELLQMVGLADHAHKLPAAVSSGQQQSAAIARALATDPPILVADEPTGNLDSRSAENVIQLFLQLVERGKTVLIVTHDPSITEHTSRTLIISDGEIIDEVVARALPLLNHQQMLSITHLINRRQYEPGQEILPVGSHVDLFYMISQGEIEVVIKSKKCPDLVAARLGPAQFFGEVELVQGGDSIASIRAVADSGPVELLVLPRQEFLNMLKDSPLTGEAVKKIVQARIVENQSFSRRCR